MNVEAILYDAIKEAANREASRIVTAAFAKGNISLPPVMLPPAVTPASNKAPAASTRRIRRDRIHANHQRAPAGCWLSLGPTPHAGTVTGQLAQAMAIAEKMLAAGPAERGVVCQLMADATPGWSRITASSCISRLVAAGRLVVVSKPAK